MRLVERHIVGPMHHDFDEIDALCFRSKNLWNTGIYWTREMTNRLGTHYGWDKLDKMLRDTNDPSYMGLCTRNANEVMKQIGDSYSSFFKSLTVRKVNPEKFKAPPRPPEFKDKVNGRNKIVFPIEGIKKQKMAAGILCLTDCSVEVQLAHEYMCLSDFYCGKMERDREQTPNKNTMDNPVKPGYPKNKYPSDIRRADIIVDKILHSDDPAMQILRNKIDGELCFLEKTDWEHPIYHGSVKVLCSVLNKVLNTDFYKDPLIRKISSDRIKHWVGSTKKWDFLFPGEKQPDEIKNKKTRAKQPKPGDPVKIKKEKKPRTIPLSLDKEAHEYVRGLNRLILEALFPMEIMPKQWLKEVRFIPKKGYYNIEVIYDQDPVVDPRISDERIAAIDIGVNNLAAIASNVPNFRPLLINGRPMKSIQQYYNKEKAYEQSLLSIGTYNSPRLDRLFRIRNSKMDFYAHQCSRYIVNKLLEYGIGILVIGKNKNWKQNYNKGRANNQNFCGVPHAGFIDQLEYKSKMVGIKVVYTSEEYTSQASLLDFEEMIGKPKNQKEGKRVKRGLFISKKDGTAINADINGAGNILRKPDEISIKESGYEGILIPEQFSGAFDKCGLKHLIQWPVKVTPAKEQYSLNPNKIRTETKYRESIQLELIHKE